MRIEVEVHLKKKPWVPNFQPLQLPISKNVDGYQKFEILLVVAYVEATEELQFATWQVRRPDEVVCSNL